MRDTNCRIDCGYKILGCEKYCENCSCGKYRDFKNWRLENENQRSENKIVMTWKNIKPQKNRNSYIQGLKSMKIMVAIEIRESIKIVVKL